MAFISCTEKSIESSNDIEGFNTFLGIEKATVLNDALTSFNEFLNINYPNQFVYNDRVRAFLEEIITKSNSNQEPEFILNEEHCKTLIKNFETSGLRKEIWVYGRRDSIENKYNLFNLLDSTRADYKPCLATLGISQDDAWDTTFKYSELEEFLDETFSNFTKEDSIDYGLIERWPENSFHNLEVNQKGAFLYGLAKYASCDTSIQNYIETKFVLGQWAGIIMASGLLNYDYDYSEPFFQRIVVVEFYYAIIRINEEKMKVNKQRLANIK